MTRHVMRLLWNRRRHNVLLVAEILCSFLVLFGVLLGVLQYAENYRQPLGFEGDRVWTIAVSTNGTDAGAQAGNTYAASLRRLTGAIGELPQVESVAAAFQPPYGQGSFVDNLSVHGQSVDYEVNEVTDAFANVFGVHPARGRWFSREDDGAAWTPVVVNERFARALFGDDDPIGRALPRHDAADARGLPDQALAKAEQDMRVIGVIADFRQHGEFSVPVHYMFRRIDLQRDTAERVRYLVVRLNADVGAAFEETLVKRMRGVAPGWSFEVTPLEQMRAHTLTMYAAPIAAAAIIAGFLLLMVVLGLTGVVWQNVTQRTREIGLRRAKGATRAGVFGQFLLELAVLTAGAVAIGLALVAQLPLLPLPSDLRLVSGSVFVLTTLIAVLGMFALTLGAGWYPSRMATRIEPADALRYE